MKCTAFDRLRDITPPFNPAPEWWKLKMHLLTVSNALRYPCDGRLVTASYFKHKALAKRAKGTLVMIAFPLQWLADIMATFATNYRRHCLPPQFWCSPPQLSIVREILFLSEYGAFISMHIVISIVGKRMQWGTEERSWAECSGLKCIVFWPSSKAGLSMSLHYGRGERMHKRECSLL